MGETFEPSAQPDLDPPTPIYTIGHSNRSIEAFIDLLHHYHIKFLVDIRSQPYSRFHPQFAKDALAQALASSHIRYVFMGDSLGGRPDDSSCYIDGRVDYARVRQQPFYQKGIQRLQGVWERHIPIALMCAEGKPQECHRSKLIGNSLLDAAIPVAHIDESGQLKTQQEINASLSNPQLSLFEEAQLVPKTHKKLKLSRKKYAPTDEDTHA